VETLKDVIKYFEYECPGGKWKKLDWITKLEWVTCFIVPPEVKLDFPNMWNTHFTEDLFRSAERYFVGITSRKEYLYEIGCCISKHIKIGQYVLFVKLVDLLDKKYSKEKLKSWKTKCSEKTKNWLKETQRYLRNDGDNFTILKFLDAIKEYERSRN